MVPEADDLDPLLFEQAGAFGVTRLLLLVLSAVHLDGQLCLVTIEINNESLASQLNRVLSAKLCVVHAAIA